MKIIYHHRTLGDGAEGIHVKEMIAAFRDLGHDVSVLSPVGEKTGQASQTRTWAERIKKLLPRAFFEFLEIGYNAAAFLALLRLVRKLKPDFIYDRYITFNASAVLLGKLAGVPVVLEVNSPLALERSQQPDERLIFRRIAHALEKWICANAYRTLVVSTPLKEYLVSIGVPASKVHVVPNGVNLARFAASVAPDSGLREKLGIAPGAGVVGFVGIMRPWHGIDLLMEAFVALEGRYPQPLHLLLVGDSPILQELEALIEKLGLRGRVTITGRVRHDDIPRYIALFDAAVSPKATFYASPMKIVEYMAMGKAVVAPGTANIRDLITDGVDGCLFDSDSRESLAQALEGLFRSPGRIADIGAAAKKTTLEKLNWNRNALTVLDWVG
ncbi:MAG: glycosyltransferase family 1 protein [Fibrobacteres bacterium]|nr:glycosyltransferase family 1 protein [Fibrobacterota bacterium]